jgi:hypothetical protein
MNIKIYNFCTKDVTISKQGKKTEPSLVSNDKDLRLRGAG